MFATKIEDSPEAKAKESTAGEEENTKGVEEQTTANLLGEDLKFNIIKTLETTGTTEGDKKMAHFKGT